MRLFYFLRSILGTVVSIFMTIIIGTSVIGIGLTLQNRKWQDFLVRIWAVTINRVFNIRVFLEGQENIPNEGVLFVFNHTSDYDIMAVIEAFKNPPRFGAKTELFKIPIFGRAMRAIGTLEIFRAERERVLQLYTASIERVRKGESFILAGEGTRVKHPGVGDKFKAGPFIFAISGEITIVPLVICGAYECLRKGQLIACTDKWRYEIRIKVLPPVSTKGLNLDDRQALQENVRQIMTKAYSAV